MTKFTDGTITKCITMKVWMDGQWSPSFEADFFEVRGLPYDEESDTYKVDDVEYLIEQANDWKHGIGDYQDDAEGQPGHTPEDRGVLIEDVEGDGDE